MPGRRTSRSEERWAALAAERSMIVRSATTQAGSRRKREAKVGSVVCDRHEGAAPQVRRMAAARLLVSADDAVQFIVDTMNNPAAPMGVRLKAAEMLKDSAGLQPTQVVKLIPSTTDDPVVALFGKILGEPDALIERPAQIVTGQVVPDRQQEAIDRLEESWTPDAEVRALPCAEDYGPVGPYQQSQRVIHDPRPPKRIREGIERLGGAGWAFRPPACTTEAPTHPPGQHQCPVLTEGPPCLRAVPQSSS